MMPTKSDIEKIQKSENQEVSGVVTARKCEHCGHHEIGIISESGDYVALKPGMKVKILVGT